MRQKGFTIIELVIAIFILSIGVVGIYSAFSVVVILTSDAKDRLIGAYLAQEGAEIIRNIRDSNWINMSLHPDTITWDNGLSYCENGSSCRADFKTPGVQPWTGGDADYLKKDGAAGFYNYIKGTITKFKREIKIECLPTHVCENDYIMKVSVRVFWPKKPSILLPGGGTESIQVEETLYDWY